MPSSPKVLREWPSKELPALLGGAKRVRERLTGEDIRQLLKKTELRFVVADVGLPLKWIPAERRFDFWKREGKPHLCEGEVIRPGNYPGEYCYVASQWEAQPSAVTILLFKYH